jgi:hypothetical protein
MIVREVAPVLDEVSEHPARLSVAAFGAARFLERRPKERHLFGAADPRELDARVEVSLGARGA